MKATKIYYQKCLNLGNYQNEVIGIEIEIEEGERALDVMEKARQFVAKTQKDKEDELPF